jgi:hypothetical protein
MFTGNTVGVQISVNIASVWRTGASACVGHMTQHFSAKRHVRVITTNAAENVKDKFLKLEFTQCEAVQSHTSMCSKKIWKISKLIAQPCISDVQSSCLWSWVFLMWWTEEVYNGNSWISVKKSNIHEVRQKITMASTHNPFQTQPLKNKSIFKSASLPGNVEVEGLGLLLRIREVPGSYLHTEVALLWTSVVFLGLTKQMSG